MALYTEDELLSVKRDLNKSMDVLIKEGSYKSSQTEKFDIFLSHSYLDKDVVIGLKTDLEKRHNISIYVDWIIDPQLDRGNITKETAEIVRMRMKNCHSLLYAISESASLSKWMPWECGYFDGYNGNVAIIPISKIYKSTFKGNEYLSLYPYLDKETIKNTNTIKLWINESLDKYVQFEDWIKGSKPFIHKNS